MTKQTKPLPPSSSNISSKILESFRGQSAKEILSNAILNKGGDLREIQTSVLPQDGNSELKDQMGQLFNLQKQGTA